MNGVKKRLISIYAILFIYWLVSIFMSFSSLAKIYITFLNPLFLLFIAVFTYYNTNGFNIRNKNKYSKNQNLIIIIISYILLYFLSGLLFGFLKNGYDLSIKGIVSNFISFFIVVLLKEYIRYRMVSTSKRNNLIFITIFFVFLDIEFKYLLNISNDIVLFKYIFQELIPIIIINITSTYLVYRIGSIPNYIYRGVLSGITLFSPIIPNLNWLVENILLLIVLIILILSIDYLVEIEDRRKRKRSIKNGNSFGTWCLFLITIVFVLFVVGFFKYQPIAILSDSMKGSFSRGDTVIIEKINDASLIEIDDVIYYKYDGKYITHRVVAIERKNDSYIFYTKGDNNLSVDEWVVNGYSVEGIVRFSIKYVGWPSVWLNELL